MAKEMGWTLEYIESLDARTLNRVLGVLDAYNAVIREGNRGRTGR